MTKATHIGSCQACGNVQKLPQGRLSLHGYDVRWHFFNGVCRGAKELPYEQSFDLIEKFIGDAQEHKVCLETEIFKLQQPAIEPKGWVHEYRKGNHYVAGGYVWRQVEILQETKQFNDGTGSYNVEHYLDHEGKQHRIDRGYHLTVLQIADLMNADYIKLWLTPKVAELARYIAWQQERIREWKLTELKPVPPPEPPDPNRKPRQRRRRWL